MAFSLGDVGGNRHVSGDSLRQPAATRDAGNDSTSVALSAPRNRRLSDFNSELLVTSTFTVSRKWTARLARSTNRSSVDELNPAILFRRITKRITNSLPTRLLIAARKINRRARFQPSLQFAILFCRGFSGSVVGVRLRALHVAALHVAILPVKLFNQRPSPRRFFRPPATASAVRQCAFCARRRPG